ncbi:MAG: ubiquinone biosynthesis accessory factor UbiJ [Thiotrichaceae bacterium]|uniref:Ubiquinone biosynthesis accessory factor UbiJ n=1 Tax=Candidatus Thiocaldithrix dubininis TaxID=3080823 RepID=A0AA95H5M8_9GAMM|nr:MAG: SCP2 sterol-binding domain-containing protein [Candidatus Thiocaldithrix dubininis]
MLLIAINASLEAAFNAWLQLEASTHGQALNRLQALQGKLIRLHITNPDMQFDILPTTERIRVSTDYAAEPDVTITGSALGFMRLATAEDSGKAMLAQGVTIAGDTGLGMQFSQILREVNIDWEELASRAVGDVMAHQLGQIARQSKGWLDDTAHAMRLNTQEYLQEEARLVPAEAELKAYLDAVDDLRMDVDRLEARLKQLEAN